MSDAPKLLYVVVVEEEEDGEAKGGSFCYTRPVLQSTLQLMGCKARHAFKISRRVFEVTRSEFSLVDLGDEVRSGISEECTENGNDGQKNSVVTQIEGSTSTPVRYGERSNSVQFELYKRQTTVVIPRGTFLDVVCDALSQYKYVGPNQRADLALACRLRERKTSVTVLLCGTSGCGKSTLSTLLASRLGITTVVSTDSIRHMMRSFVDEKDNPLVWSSTYHAGEHLDPVEVAKAKARRKAKKLSGTLRMIPEDELIDSDRANTSHSQDAGTELISKKQMAIEGYKAQSEMVIDGLDRLITSWEHKKESVVVEGVHLSLNFVMGLMKSHPSIIPFMLYISNEEKHMERFAVRAKYMTLDPSKNKYVKYIRNIRTIQEYLCNRADKHLVPKVNNSNVDRSVAAIHATVFSCLRRREAGEQLYDLTTNTVSIIEEEYRGQCTANTSSSKGMFQLIQRQGSSRHLMALVNTDGSVAKAWPVDSADDAENSRLGNGNGKKSTNGPLYGPLQIGKAEPVNLQFGSFGISAWPSDAASTSHTGSIDESGAGGTDTGSRYYSSCCSSPRLSMSDGPAKELKEESSVSGSDEEGIDPQPTDTDDLSDIDDQGIHEEIEGSVDEESTKSDEEYDDLAMRDSLENGYWSDEDEPKPVGPKTRVINSFDLERYNRNLETYNRNLDPFLQASRQCVEPAWFHSPLSSGRFSRSADGRVKKRSLSDSSGFFVQPQGIPTLDKKGSSHVQGTILTTAPSAFFQDMPQDLLGLQDTN